MSDRYDLVVLGGGTAGLVSSVIAASVGARVALVERDRTGGDCLCTGCVPSKSLIASARLAHRMRHADAVGLAAVEPAIDFAQVMACGSQPALPPIAGLDGDGVLTTESVWALREMPRRLVVLGGGPIGCELGQAFARLGSDVTLVEVAERLLLKEEPAASALIAERLAADGVNVRLGARAIEVCRRDGSPPALVLETAAGREVMSFDRILAATGRSPRSQDIGLGAAGGGGGAPRPRNGGQPRGPPPRSQDIGLGAAGVELDARGAVIVDNRLRTSAPRIFAAGDVTARLPFTHVAAHHARVATVNALFGLRRTVDEAIPWVTFTDPEVARVGLTEAQARERWGARATIARGDYASLDRAITDRDTQGFALLVADPRGRLVGATVAAPGAGEVIAELTARVKGGDKLDAISTTVHAYPTLAEGPARAADEQLRRRYAGARYRALARPILAARRMVARS